MKKRRLLVSLGALFGFCLFLSACRQRLEASEWQEVVNQVAGLSMETEQRTYPAGTRELDLILRNDTGTEYYYGVAYVLEKKEGSLWYTVPFKDDVAWIEIALLLEPNSQNTEKIDFSLIDYPLEAGEYRIIKEVAGNVLAATFRLEE